MSLQIECSKCGASYRVRDQLAGKLVQCKQCKEPIEVAHVASAESVILELDDADQIQDSVGVASWNDLRSYAGSLVFHIILLLAAMAWTLAAKTSSSDHFVLATSSEDDLIKLESLNENEVQIESPNERPLDMSSERKFVAQLLAEEIDWLSVPAPVLPESPTSNSAHQQQGAGQDSDQGDPAADQGPDAMTALVEQEIQRRLDRAGGKSGAVQVSLVWNNGNDLDLYVQTPVKDIIAFNYKRSRCGGELDVDMNARKTQSLSPVENVYWAKERTPFGVFFVGVSEYQNHGYRDPTRYLISVKVDGEVHHFRGSIRLGKTIRGVCKFKRTADGVEFLETPSTMEIKGSGELIRK